jgi:hypothetical protein
MNKGEMVRAGVEYVLLYNYRRVFLVVFVEVERKHSFLFSE